MQHEPRSEPSSYDLKSRLTGASFELGCSAKAELADRLERMIVDVRAQPEWREPTLPESAAKLAVIKAYLSEHFGWRESALDGSSDALP